MRAVLHIALHIFVPALVARWCFTENKLKMWLWMIAGIAIDIDHLFADPLYDPNRCSIGFHPLHLYEIMPVYLSLCFFKKTRALGIGLCIHMVLDMLDCVWMQSL